MTRPLDQDTEPHDVLTDCRLDASPETVWRTLREPEFLSAWLLLVTAMSEDGMEFELDGTEAGLSAKIRCRLIASVRSRVLRYRWVEEPANPAAVHRPDLVTDVTFWLTETESGGTRLRIVHRALPQMIHGERMTMMMSGAANSNQVPGVRHAA